MVFEVQNVQLYSPSGLASLLCKCTSPCKLWKHFSFPFWMVGGGQDASLLRTVIMYQYRYHQFFFFSFEGIDITSFALGQDLIAWRLGPSKENISPGHFLKQSEKLFTEHYPARQFFSFIFIQLNLMELELNLY